MKYTMRSAATRELCNRGYFYQSESFMRLFFGQNLHCVFKEGIAKIRLDGYNGHGESIFRDQL